MVFLVQNKKPEHRHRFQHIQMILGSKFYFKQTILIFWTKFADMGISGIKQKKGTSLSCLKIRISLVTKFHPTQNLGLFKHCLNYQKFEHYHLFQHIQTSLGAKGNLKQAILIFSTKIQKRYFYSKTKVVNITI